MAAPIVYPVTDFTSVAVGAVIDLALFTSEIEAAGAITSNLTGRGVHRLAKPVDSIGVQFQGAALPPSEVLVLDGLVAAHSGSGAVDAGTVGRFWVRDGAPGSSDDRDSTDVPGGYRRTDTWIRTPGPGHTSGEVHVCTEDTSGSAIWVETGS